MQSFRHDLFRLEPAALKKNLSFKVGEVKIEHIKHSHFFHTFDSNGRAQQYSTPTGGHFHEVKWHVDPDTGDLVAKCGPPLKITYIKKGGVQRKKITPIKWENYHGNEFEEDENKKEIVVDNHIHEVTYAWSEELSADTVRKRRDAQEAQARREMADKVDAKRLGLEGID